MTDDETKARLTKQVLKHASENGEEMTDAEAIALVNDKFHAGLFSHEKSFDSDEAIAREVKLWFPDPEDE